MSINVYYNQIKKYYSLKVKLVSIINSLNDSSSHIEGLPKAIFNVYSLNNVDASISKECKSLTDDIISTSNYIKNVVIPSIDNAIEKIKYYIAKLEEAEANSIK